MPKLDCPLQLSPVFKPKIWGRESLEPIFAVPEGTPAPRAASRGSTPETSDNTLIGEVWITDDASRFLNGPLADLTLAEASRKYGTQLHGRGWKHARFPLLAKYIYTSDWLSVQVHPDDDYARVHDPGSLGKVEMWYFVHAGQRAAVLLGLKRAVNKAALRAALEEGTSRELLYKFRPRPREAVFVPPGTIHALGPGLVLFEVEQNSDLTYRLDDFGRAGLDGKLRPLHLEKGIEVIRVEAPALRDLPRLKFRELFGWRRYVLACRHFALEELSVEKPAAWKGSPERVEVLSLLEGEGRVETQAGWLGYHAGETWVIPPATERYRLVPARKTRLLKFYVPDVEEHFRRPLLKRGVARRKIDQICFY
jgi:mannose-6-phosphate isomerase